MGRIDETARFAARAPCLPTETAFKTYTMTQLRSGCEINSTPRYRAARLPATQKGSVPAAMSQNAGIQRPTNTHAMSETARPFAGNLP
jgi:hypothetical protein